MRVQSLVGVEGASEGEKSMMLKRARSARVGCATSFSR